MDSPDHSNNQADAWAAVSPTNDDSNAATIRVASALSTPSPPESETEAESRPHITSVGSGGARTRGLTSALSGRRQRSDAPRLSSPEGSAAAAADNSRQRPYASLYDSQASIDTPVLGRRHEMTQETAPWMSPTLRHTQIRAIPPQQQQQQQHQYQQ
ncbi:hypothetical protein H4217_001486, partial [Coemansia sp. RSA 1939]